MMAASPSALIRSHSSGSGMCWLRHRTTSVRIDGRCSSNQPLSCAMKLSELAKPTSTRKSFFPSTVSSAEAIPLALTAGGYPSGFRTLNMANSHLLGPGRCYSIGNSLLSLALARRRRMADRDLPLAEVAGDQKLAIGLHRLRALVEDDLPVGEHVPAVCDLERELDVLLDEQHAAARVERVPMNDREQ